ncbi:RNA-directed DNA polymerase, eukaryota [Tanacetum coccineum]|uniref:RNA-directed DNA polymerase, eukaryota n=1 Tax=Tanacetum coccineum TaxID=301880 RepID=A0ABQ5A9U7_9ASTR
MTGGYRDNTRRRFQSNEDLTQKISHSIFVTNFPDHVNSRDLWNKCSVYGTVVDVFIPIKKSKAGKRFAFVRFIKVPNLERLVENLCTLWIGSYHLFANQVRFERSNLSVKYTTKAPQLNVPKKNTAQGNGLMGFQQKKGAATSYTSAVNGENSQVRPGNSVSLAPALVLDEECIMERDFSNCAMGRVKAFDSIIKLQSILVDEGFVNVTLSYLGGLWVMFECDNIDTKSKLVSHIGINSWFQVIHDVSQDFVSDERVVWIDIEGVPLYAWSRKSFEKIGSKWGELLNIEDASDSSFGRKRLCILTKHPVSIFESFKIIVKGKVFMVRAKELFTWNPTFESIKEQEYSSDEESTQGADHSENQHSSHEKEEGEINSSTDEGVAETDFMDNSSPSMEHSVHKENEFSADPFGLNELLGIKKNPVEEISKLSPSLSHPPGFSPEVVLKASDKESNKEFSPQISAKVMNNSQVVHDVGSFNSDGGGGQNIGGSVLGVLEEMIRVGRAMGYSMEGCEKDIEFIINSKGDESVFR